MRCLSWSSSFGYCKPHLADFMLQTIMIIYWSEGRSEEEWKAKMTHIKSFLLCCQGLRPNVKTGKWRGSYTCRPVNRICWYISVYLTATEQVLIDLCMWPWVAQRECLRSAVWNHSAILSDVLQVVTTPQLLNSPSRLRFTVYWKQQWARYLIWWTASLTAMHE